MKKMSLMSAVTVVMVMLGSGCTSITTSDGAQKVETPHTINYGYETIFEHKDTRINGASEIIVLFGLFAWGADGFAENTNLLSGMPSATNAAKSAAVYDACQSASVDTLVGTRYIVTTTDYFFFRTIRCEVAGFPLTMVGIKKVEPFVLRGKEADTLVFLTKAPTVVK